MGRDPGRVEAARAEVPPGPAEVRGAVVDVADAGAVARFAASLAVRHGGVDIVFANHYARIQPDDDPAAVVHDYVAVNSAFSGLDLDAPVGAGSGEEVQEPGWVVGLGGCEYGRLGVVGCQAASAFHRDQGSGTVSVWS